MAFGVGVQGLMTLSIYKKIRISILPSCQHQRKPRHPKSENFFFILNYKPFPIFRGFEELSSSTCWRAMNFSQNGQKRLPYNHEFKQHAHPADILI